MVTKELETHISKDQIKAVLAPYLTAGGLINKYEDLIDIGIFGDDKLIPIKLQVQKLEGGEAKENG